MSLRHSRWLTKNTGGCKDHIDVVALVVSRHNYCFLLHSAGLLRLTRMPSLTNKTPCCTCKPSAAETTSAH